MVVQPERVTKVLVEVNLKKENLKETKESLKEENLTIVYKNALFSNL
jgi:hypothetical protein